MSSADQPQAPAPQGNPQPHIQPTIEPDTLEPIYTNFARVTGSPEELILDFGLNTQPLMNVSTPVKISERLVMNYYTAKRLWHTLGVSLQRHEETFGILEIDVTRRVLPTARGTKVS